MRTSMYSVYSNYQKLGQFFVWEAKEIIWNLLLPFYIISLKQRDFVIVR